VKYERALEIEKQSQDRAFSTADENNKIEKAKYDLIKEKMKDPIYFQTTKLEAIKSIYDGIYCGNKVYRNMDGQDPIVCAFDNFLAM
jgi:hypothetical protein